MGKDSRDLPGQALLDAAWFDPIEEMIRDRVRGFIENLVEAELDDALGRSRYQRPGTANVASRTAGYRHGRRARQLLGWFGAVTIEVPRALIAGTYLSGTNTRRVRRALGALFQGSGRQRCCQPHLA